MASGAVLIRVHSHWDDWRHAEVSLEDLRDVHWFRPIRAPHALVHAYISCSNIVTGDIPHACDRRSAPHRLLVCVLKKHTIPATYAELARRAHERQTSPQEALDSRSTALHADEVVVRRLASTALLTANERLTGRLHT